MLFIKKMKINIRKIVKDLDTTDVIKRFLPLLSVFILVVMYALGIRPMNDENIVLNEQKDKLKSEIQKLQAEKIGMHNVMSNVQKLVSVLETEEVVVNKAAIFYVPEQIEMGKGYLLIDCEKEWSEIKDLEFQRQQEIHTQKLINTFTQILMEVEKCKNIFQQACVIQQVYPLRLKVYYLQ